MNFLSKSLLEKFNRTFIGVASQEGINNSLPNPKFNPGSFISYVPLLGEPIKLFNPNQESPFLCYTFSLPNSKCCCYLRIPHYDLNRNQLESLSKIIESINSVADVMLIDQLNNPGGNMFSMYSVLSFLIEKTIKKIPKHSLRIVEEDYKLALDNLELAKLNEIENNSERISENIQKYSQFIIDEWKAGRRGVNNLNTNYTYIGGISEIPPASIHYSKKLVILNNSKTASAAEFFSAILQDENRAIIAGEVGAGAGGCCKNLGSFKDFDLEIKVSWTTALRYSGIPIENVGVVPEKRIALCPEDLTTDYLLFSTQILNLLTDMVNS